MKPSSNKNTSVFPHGHIDRPNGKRVKLGDVCKVCRGVRVVRSELSHGTYLVYQNSLMPLGRYDKSNVPSGTTFIIAAGSAGEIGYRDEPFWAADDCYYLLPQIGVVSKYVYYALVASRYHISGLVRRGSVPRLARDIVECLEIQLPDESMQLGIVDTISAVDNLIIAQQSLVAKYEAIKKATVNLLLKPKNGWRRVKIEDIFDIKVGGDLDIAYYSKTKTSFYRYEVVSNSLSNRGLYGYTSLPKFPADSITITGRGNVGHAEYRDDQFDAIVRIVVLTPIGASVCAKFVTELINITSPFQIESTGVPQLTAPQIAAAIISLPPIDEQKRIVATLDTIDNSIKDLKAQLEKSQAIKQGMMAYFFG